MKMTGGVILLGAFLWIVGILGACSNPNPQPDEYTPEVWEAATKACEPVGGIKSMRASQGWDRSLSKREWTIHANCKNEYISLIRIPVTQ